MTRDASPRHFLKYDEPICGEEDIRLSNGLYWRDDVTHHAERATCQGCLEAIVADEAKLVEIRARIRVDDAAPDLLAALNGLMSIIEESRGVDGWHLNGDVVLWAEFDDDIQAANAAITLATEVPS